MKQTTIYLIRHGEVEYQKDSLGRRLIYGPDIPLSREGREQMSKLGLSIQQETHRLNVIYTSPYFKNSQ